MMKKAGIMILVISLLMSLVIPTAVFADTHSNVADGYDKVGESPNLVLYYNSERYAFAVEDKRNGYVWYTIIDDESEVFESITSRSWQTASQSSFFIRYANLRAIRGTNILADEVVIETTQIQNGKLMHIDFTNIKVSMEVHVYLEGDALTVDIPIETIREYGDEFGIANIQVFPYFGTASPRSKGYAVYPDGAGGLYHFNPRVSVYSQQYTWNTYYDDRINFRELRIKYDDNDHKNAMLPFYGLKVEDNAFVGLITVGEADTRIHFAPAGRRIYGNHVFGEFVYRRLFYDARFNEKTPINYVQADRVEHDGQIKFFFTQGEDATYSGMANRVREYYLESGLMSSKIQPDDAVPMQVDLFMGIKEDRVLIDKFIRMTTFNQAQTVIDAVKSAGVENLLVLLEGWNRDGYGDFAPTNYRVPWMLGGTWGLRNLAEFASENNVPLGLKVDYVNAFASTSGYNRRADLIYDLNNILLAHRGQFLFDPIRSYRLFFNRFMPRAQRHGITAMGFDEMGFKLYANYKDRNIVDRYVTAQYWSQFGQTVQSMGMKAAYGGGNAYLLNTADFLYDVPYEDSGYFITDQTIPFYQMVVNGSVPYTAYPGNLSFDFDWMKLKWIEYGCYPYFVLSYQRPDLLINIEDNEIFSSHYLTWLDSVERVNREFQDMKDVYNSYMIRHEVFELSGLVNEVVRITYSNGAKVYINYDPYEDASIDGHVVPAKDYIVVRGGM